ncbi:MAG: hypothetical protein ACKVQR_10700 [Aquabacterium sp.]
MTTDPAAPASGRPGGEPTMDPERVRVRLRYATWLLWCTRAGMLLLAIGFVLYMSSWLPADVPATDVARHWHLPLAGYLAATGAPTGWQWLAHLPNADAFGLAGIAWLAGCSAVALLAVLPMFWRRGERVQAVLVLLQVAVLLLAAQGIGGGH